MSAFPIVHSALEGFRFTREHPRALLPWIACIFVAGLAGNAVIVALGGPAALAEVQRIAAAGTGDVAQMAEAAARALPSLVVGATLQVLLSTVLAASAFRVLLTGDARVRLRFGVQEARLLAVSVMLAAISFGLSLIGVASAGLGAVVGTGAPAAGALLTLLGESAGLALQVWLMVRLALAAPLSVAEGRIDLGEAWRRTGGRFWPMLGALLMAAGLYLVVVMLGYVIFYTAAALLLAGPPTAPPTPAQGLADAFTPLTLLSQAFVAAMFALGVPILAGPLAAAYRAFSPR